MCALVLITAVTAISCNGPAKSPAVNADRNGVAIEGYDPVAYFTMGKPVKGNEDYSATWMGARWRFASAGHRDLFEKDPERYAPRYGGYCAYGVANNYLVDIDPEAWTIHEDRLYLNFSLSVRDLWKEDIPRHIRMADINWPVLIGEGKQ